MKPFFPLCTLAALLAGCGGDPVEVINTKPSFLGDVKSSTYDAQSDDLLTAGLGKSGLAGTAPNPANAEQPSAAELRKLAIYTNYRALVDMTANGGYGSLYGPNIDSSGKDSLGEGKIAGKEFTAYADDGTGRQNVTMVVQIPSSFNKDAPCIVSAAASGSRGVYGAIATAGEWGLKRGCAVAYTDKGLGNAVHDLQNHTVTLQDGSRSSAVTAGKASAFTANLSDIERSAFNQAFPNRFAVKHAHSQQNPEKDWGKFTLQAIEMAFYLVNQEYAALAKDGKQRLLSFTAKNTIVIASSVSNGGGAALAALEQDEKGLISGVAVAEPNVSLAPESRLSIVQGSQRWAGSGKSLYDYSTLANLLQPCAALAPAAANAPFRSSINTAQASARCTALRNQGLISGENTEAMANSAQAALLAAGFLPEGRDLHASMYAFAVPAIVTTYANSYGRFGVQDNLCAQSFSNAVPVTQLAQVFGRGNGLPPMLNIAIFNNASVGGATLDTNSISASTGLKDYNIDAALCQRELAVGSSERAKRVQGGLAEIQRNGNLRGKPALIVHGRADSLIPVNHSSRAYFGVNKMREGSASRLSYIEVTNAQHFDSFLSFAGYDSRYIPLHVYFNQAMDMMYAHLRQGTALPASQVVRTTPRGTLADGSTAPISAAKLPAIKTTPASADAIGFANNVVTIPD